MTEISGSALACLSAASPIFDSTKESGVNIRVSIESEEMGIYKSIAYEIFKQRESTLYAFDGAEYYP